KEQEDQVANSVCGRKMPWQHVTKTGPRDDDDDAPESAGDTADGDDGPGLDRGGGDPADDRTEARDARDDRADDGDREDDDSGDGRLTRGEADDSDDDAAVQQASVQTSSGSAAGSPGG